MDFTSRLGFLTGVRGMEDTDVVISDEDEEEDEDDATFSLE